jgi:hypothetical protein
MVWRGVVQASSPRKLKNNGGIAPPHEDRLVAVRPTTSSAYVYIFLKMRTCSLQLVASHNLSLRLLCYFTTGASLRWRLVLKEKGTGKT